ncbi:MAG: hypothetical protein HY056_11140 [Proteobacteria bacterium]|nr:hypothetical protein [Pseudomonadota bacterium]
MRRFLLTLAAIAALMAVGPLNAQRADAMPLPTPSGLLAAIEGVDLAQDVAYVCRRVWRCNHYGCGWRQSCYWRPNRHYRPHRYRHHQPRYRHHRRHY